LTLRIEGAGDSAMLRVRRALKFLLRTCGLRCVKIEEVPVGRVTAEKARE
jgi:hypothetical protein